MLSKTKPVLQLRIIKLYICPKSKCHEQYKLTSNQFQTALTPLECQPEVRLNVCTTAPQMDTLFQVPNLAMGVYMRTPPLHHYNITPLHQHAQCHRATPLHHYTISPNGAGLHHYTITPFHQMAQGCTITPLHKMAQGYAITPLHHLGEAILAERCVSFALMA